MRLVEIDYAAGEKCFGMVEEEVYKVHLYGVGCHLPQENGEKSRSHADDVPQRISCVRCIERSLTYE